jgi:hypothetical protein
MGNFASVISCLRNKAQLTRTYVDEGVARTSAGERREKSIIEETKI